MKKLKITNIIPKIIIGCDSNWDLIKEIKDKNRLLDSDGFKS